MSIDESDNQMVLKLNKNPSHSLQPAVIPLPTRKTKRRNLRKEKEGEEKRKTCNPEVSI